MALLQAGEERRLLGIPDVSGDPFEMHTVGLGAIEEFQRDEVLGSIDHVLGNAGVATLTVDVSEPPYAFVTLTGRVELTDDVDAMLPWAVRLGARYMGAERGQEFGRRNAVPGELLVRLVPDKVVALDGIAD